MLGSRPADRLFMDELFAGLDRLSGQASEQQEYQAFIDRYQNDPVAFWQEVMRDSTPTAYQQDVCRALIQHRRVCVRSPHGAGKTHMASFLVWWFMLTHPFCKVITTASAFRQLKDYFWPEVHMHARRIVWARTGFSWNPDYLMKTRIEMGHADWIAVGITSHDHQKLEGAHAEHILIVFDEAKAIPAATWDALEGAMTTEGAYALAISTPGIPSGRFYEIQTRKPGTHDWWVRHITVDEVIAAGRVTDEWVENRREQWGASSSTFLNRVLGEFSTEDAEAFIPLSWVEAAVQRWEIYTEALIQDGLTQEEAIQRVLVWQNEFFAQDDGFDETLLLGAAGYRQDHDDYLDDVPDADAIGQDVHQVLSRSQAVVSNLTL